MSDVWFKMFECISGFAGPVYNSCDALKSPWRVFPKKKKKITHTKLELALFSRVCFLAKKKYGVAWK